MFLPIYLLLVNGLSFLIMGIDKRRAAKRKWRISENFLFGIALLGGAVGTYISMKVFHHKTKHASFRFGIPVLIVLQLILIVWILIKMEVL